MATYTTHYNLKKPASGDYVNVADLNGNADIIDTELYDKVDKETGKGLSTNDYTTEEKTKLAGIESGAQVNPSAASANPLMDGTASAGSSSSYARGDHVHPSDTTKVDKETGKGLSANDYTDEDKAKLAELSQYVGAGIIFDTASGSMASFSDGGDGLPVKSVSVNVDPVQDLHGYDKPWTGGAGKNLLPSFSSTTVEGVTVSVDNFGVVTLNGSCSTTTQITTNVVLPPGEYKLNGAYGNNDFYTSSSLAESNRMFVSIGGTNYFDNVTGGVAFTLTQNTNVVVSLILVRTSLTGITFNNSKVYPMVRLASDTDSTFEPYSNICPITGHTSAVITRVGKNWLNVKQSSSSAFTRNGEVFTNTNTDTRNFFNLQIKNGNDGTQFYFQRIETTGKIVTRDFTISADITNLIIKHSGASHDLLVAFPQLIKAGTYKAVLEITGYNPSVVGGLSFKNVMLISPTDSTDFEPYQGHVYNVTFPGSAGTVYGGTLDVTNGTLTVNTAYIASYSGQTIGEPWVSSMDEYVTGATPTTGAEVVYTVSNPTTYNLTLQEITTLLGINHIWADTGDVSVEYAADPKLYINKVIANALNA